MKVEVDKELCISCGFCVSAAPDIYTWDDDGKAMAPEENVPQAKEGEAKEGVEGCPTEAIKEL